MDIIWYILFFTLISSVASSAGGILLIIKEKFIRKISHFLISFAAGTLLGAAFFDLLPEAEEAVLEGSSADIFLWALAGILIFFLLERFIHHHGHGKHHEEEKSVVSLVIIGDSLHNFIDGVATAATFLISIPLGIVTALAVAAHEIPQEIGDFGLLLHKGVSRKNVILLNFYSSLAALVGAILTYWIKDAIQGLLPMILALTSGFFIYIAVANLIPEIHLQGNRQKAFWETIMLLLGVLTIYWVVTLLEGRT